MVKVLHRKVASLSFIEPNENSPWFSKALEPERFSFIIKSVYNHIVHWQIFLDEQTLLHFVHSKAITLISALEEAASLAAAAG